MSEQEEQYEREVEFAAMGAQVLNNAAYTQAMTIRKAQIFELFCKTKQEQGDVREEAWRTMQNINALEDWLNTALTTGKMAQQSLDQNKDES